MKDSIFKSRAAFALNMILTADNVDYESMPRSQMCFYIQDNHADIEKEIAHLLEKEWDYIKKYDKGGLLKRFWIRIHYYFSDTHAQLVLSDEVVESIVDVMLPDIIAFFETEEGRKEFEEWKAEQKIKKAEKQ